MHKDEEKLKKVEEERADALEMAAQENEEREEKEGCPVQVIFQ
jgi:hypothetical protein